jgi:hypothetical protein
LKKLTVFMALLVFTLIFASQTSAAGLLDGNNGLGTSSTNPRDNTGSVLGGNRTGIVGTTGTTGVSGTGMSGTGYGTGAGMTGPGTGMTGGYGSTGTSTYGSTGYSSPSTYGGTSSTSYGTHGTMRGYNSRTNAATNNTGTSNWGWLGLLGLIGLAGMRSGNRDENRSGNKV